MKKVSASEFFLALWGGKHNYTKIVISFNQLAVDNGTTCPFFVASVKWMSIGYTTIHSLKSNWKVTNSKYLANFMVSS